MNALSARAQDLLKLIIEQYIADGKPVASKSLLESCKLDVSSATIRNVMSELEKLGLLISPHTSSGRVPTPEGYRLFVNQLLTVNPLEPSYIEEFKQHFESDQTPQALLQSTTSLLSSLSQLVGIITLPTQQKQILSHIEFLPMTDGRILVILVLNEREVQNRIIDPQAHLSESTLIKFGNFLTEKYAGEDLNVVKEALAHDLAAEQRAFHHEYEMLSEVMPEIFTNSANEEKRYEIVGETNLLPLVDEVGVEKLQQILESFKEKQAMLSLFDNCLQADGVHIYIGGESECSGLQGCSMVTATYHVDAEPVGLLGVIGPNRMHYEKVIPLVDITAKLLSNALK